LKGTEKVFAGSHLTMYIRVSILKKEYLGFYLFFIGRALGTDGAIAVFRLMKEFL
jgi:hypothetical protein